MELQELSTSGLVFMILSWTAIIALNVFCLYKIFKKK